MEIDLGGDGQTPNDAGDSDQGPNDLLNTPELEIAIAIPRDSTEGQIDGDSITVLGKLDVNKAGDYLMDVYVGTNCSDTRNYLGSVVISVTAGNLSPKFRTPAIVGEEVFLAYVIVTLTDPDKNTSEASCGISRRSDFLDGDVRRRYLFGLSSGWDPNGNTRLIGHKEITTLLEHWDDFPKGD